MLNKYAHRAVICRREKFWWRLTAFIFVKTVSVQGIQAMVGDVTAAEVSPEGIFGINESLGKCAIINMSMQIGRLMNSTEQIMLIIEVFVYFVYNRKEAGLWVTKMNGFY